MAKQLGWVVDSEKCIGCFTCAMACKNQYHQPTVVVWRYVYPLAQDIYPHRERAFYSLACNHCQNPECLRVCPADAYYKREKDGIVIHNEQRCIGCRNCVRSCPYGAPRYNPDRRKAEKCCLCYQRIDAGLLPACALSCPVGALRVVDLDKFDSTGLLRFPPGFPREPNLNPSTRFNFPRTPIVVRRKDI